MSKTTRGGSISLNAVYGTEVEFKISTVVLSKPGATFMDRMVGLDASPEGEVFMEEDAHPLRNRTAPAKNKKKVCRPRPSFGLFPIWILLYTT
jgi:hypothetical protein